MLFAIPPGKRRLRKNWRLDCLPGSQRKLTRYPRESSRFSDIRKPVQIRSTCRGRLALIFRLPGGCPVPPETGQNMSLESVLPSPVGISTHRPVVPNGGINRPRAQDRP